MKNGRTVIYRGEPSLGEGAQGVVYPCVLREVIDGVVIEKNAAVKCEFRDKCISYQMIVDRLDTWGGIPHHENVVELYAWRVLEAHESHNFVSLSVTERMECNLSQLIHGDEGFARGCTYGILVGILQQICKGLDHLHKNKIIHFDIKPSNVLISKDAEGKIVAKLADFDSSRVIVVGNSVTQTKRGTPAYMAPEVVVTHPVRDSSWRFTPTVDVYSLGVLMWEVLNRKDPKDNSDLDGEIGREISWSWIEKSQQIWCEAPEPLCKLVEWCMSYKSSRITSHDQGRPSVGKVLKAMSTMNKKAWWKQRAHEYDYCQVSCTYFPVEMRAFCVTKFAVCQLPWRID